MNRDLQEEEREVVLSIYDGDTAFHQLSPVTYQYKYGDDGSDKSFLVELTWGDNYPEDLPSVNMDTFYNKHLSEEAKNRVRDFVLREAQELLGTAMTYSLFECIKDKIDQLITDDMVNSAKVNGTFNDEVEADDEECGHDDEETSDEESAAKEITGATSRVKKEHLTKAQKRRQWDRVDCRGERPRGWNWVDVIHHLGQTGSKACTDFPNS